MIVLADNDLLLKLAQCDLIAHLGEILNTQIDEIYVTATARYQLLGKSREKGIAKCGNEASLDRLKHFLESTQILPEVKNTDLLATLASFSNIDSGEQQIFASSTELDDALILTGDKASLIALIANAESVAAVFKAVTGNVVIFESFLLLALKKIGFPALKQKLFGNPKPDGMLRLVLRENMTEDSLTECLRSYAKPVEQLLWHREQLPL